MIRDLRIWLVLALLVATAGAFVAAQHLKLEPTPFRAVTVTKLFSPVCECKPRVAEIGFRLRKASRVTILIVDGSGLAIRHLVDGEPVGRTPARFTWDGRDDAGAVVPDGVYRPRVHLDRTGQTFDLPNRIQVDATPPRVRIVSAAPRTISPDGDGRADRTTIRYAVDEPAVTRLFVDGKPRVRVRGLGQAHKIEWSGRIGGRVRPGLHTLAVVSHDRAGNVGRAAGTVALRIRFVVLPDRALRARPGKRFAIAVDTDALTVAWRLGTRHGTAPAQPLRLRAPKRPGRYTLWVRVGAHAARATVRVTRR